MDKIKKIFKEYKLLWITFLLACLVISVVYYLQGVAPFGDKSLLTIDFFHQYGPMLGELYDRIKDGSNLIYSFNMGMGLPFFRNFFNYLSSPFNIVMFLFERKDLLLSYSVIIGLKVMLSATFMCYYLKKKFNDNNYMYICLSLLYAFSAYFIAYYWNIMWLDGMVFLPLITLGIENIVNNKKPLLYIISLSIMLFANYFIGWMVCIFSVLYFLTYLIMKNNKFDVKNVLSKCIIFGLSSLLVGGLCAWFLIPMYDAIGAISATSDVMPSTQYYNFTISELFYNHLSGVGTSVLKSDGISAPNISCGIIPIALFLLFILNKDISTKVKIGYITLIVILTASFFIAPLDFIWHAFHVPNDLPYRYSFIYTFIMIIIGGYSLKNIKRINPLLVFGVYIVSLIIIYSVKDSSYTNISSDMIWLNAIILTIFFLVYILYKYFNSKKRLAVIFAVIAIVFECTIKINNTWEISHDLKSFYNDYDNTKEVINFINKNNDEMSRTERINMLTFNDSSWYGYYGQTAFSSMEYENLALLQHNLGMPGNEINSFYYKTNTPIFNAMFNIKYVISNGIDDFYNYSLYYNNNNMEAYKNYYAIGLLYGVKPNIKNWTYTFSNAINNQNDFVDKSTGINNIFSIKDFISSEIIYDKNRKVIIKYVMENPNSNYYYYIDNHNIDFVYNERDFIYLSDNYDYKSNIKEDLIIQEYISYHEKFIVNNSSIEDNVVFYVGYNNYIDDLFKVYTIDEVKLNDAYKYYLNNKVSINEFKENYIKATSNFNEKLTCYTSIPYDNGWKIYVDGKKVQTFLIGNALLGFDVDKGEHDIILKYEIPYFKLGFVISLCSLLGIIVINNKKINKGINN